MNVTKCTNDHFYDADKYDVCPHCGAGPTATSEKQNNEISEKKHRFFRERKTTNDVEIAPVPDQTIGKTFGIFGDEQKDGKSEQEKVVSEDNDHGNTTPMNNAMKTCQSCGKEFAEQSSNSDLLCPECSKLETDNSEKNSEVSEEIESKKQTNLVDEIKKISVESSDKTVGFFYSAKNNENNKEQKATTEPVVGWLVCVKGNHFGETFGIFAGRNSVGRSDNNRIIIKEDKTISREKHAWITYEPKKRKFYVQPGESTGITYLNGDDIMESHQLKYKDMLEFGDGKFMFVPLCGDDFSWEDYIND